MPPDPRLDDTLLTSLPAAGVWAVAAAALAGWIALHRVAALAGWRGAAVRVAAGAVALRVLCSALMRHFVLAGSWPLWVWAVVAAASIESAVALLAFERRQLPPRAGRTLVALRVAAVAAVLTIFLQPVFVWTANRRIQRDVVVLVDESVSMQLTDSNRTVRERLELAGLPVDSLPGSLLAEGETLQARCRTAADGLSQEDTPVAPALAGEIAELSRAIDDWSGRVQATVDGAPDDLPEDVRDARPEVVRLLAVTCREAAANAARRSRDGHTHQTRLALREAVEAFGLGLRVAKPLAAALDERTWNRLPEAERTSILAAVSRPRRDLAADALRRPAGEGPDDILTALRRDYGVRFLRFARSVREADDLTAPADDDPAWQNRTDVAAAMEYVRNQWPPESLAGIVLLTDARHNGTESPERPARALGLQGSPVCTILTGSRRGVTDAAIAAVSHPHTIFLGDRLRVNCDVRAAGLRGESLTLQLLRDGTEVASREVAVDADPFQESVRLEDLPEEAGVHSWEVRLAPAAGEEFDANNSWRFDAAVSDDRINVLLADDRPRWEFRYLRNLFDGRDKSVHLQYLLHSPDALADAPPRPVVHASAGRPFGESEATTLPDSPEEWRMFDAIVLGDLPPTALDDATLAILRDCVVDRGALLVLVAGPNAMPAAYFDGEAQSLIPVLPPPGPAADDAPFRFALTAAGRGHNLFDPPDDRLANRAGWEEFPAMTWRFAHGGVREGAEALAWAGPLTPESSAASGGDPATLLQRRRDAERRRALVVAAPAGNGRVVMLAFDQTWRFRYGTGDRWHHRFWGNLLRGGAGENLAAGTGGVRMGLDRFAAEPGEPVRIAARLAEADRRPLANARVEVVVSRNGRAVRTLPLAFREGSRGIYEATVDGLDDPGEYRVELSGPDVGRLLAEAGAPPVGMNLTVAADRNPVETGDVRPDPDAAARWAAASGGVVTGVNDAARILPVFGPGSRDVAERRHTTLWDHWILLAVAMGAVSAEWMLRRRWGLV